MDGTREAWIMYGMINWVRGWQFLGFFLFFPFELFFSRRKIYPPRKGNDGRLTIAWRTRYYLRVRAHTFNIKLTILCSIVFRFIATWHARRVATRRGERGEYLQSRILNNQATSVDRFYCTECSCRIATAWTAMRQFAKILKSTREIR